MPLRRKLAWSSSAAAGAGALAVAALLVVAFRPRPVLVDVAEIATAAMRVTVDEEGRTRVRNVYTVSTPVAGRMLRSPLLVGDAVEAKRTTLAVIEETVPAFLDVRARREIEAQLAAAGAAVDLAAAEVRQVESELSFAQSEHERAKVLIRNKTIADRSLEKAKVDVETKQALLARAKANLEVRRRELDSLRAKLLGPVLDPERAVRDESACCVSILAPVSGRVLRRMQESEKVVPAGAPLVEIGDVADLELVVELLSTDAVKVREGATATIESWGGPRALAAKVRRIEPAGFTKVSALGIEEQRVNVVLDLVSPLEQRAQLGHDYRVLVRIDVWTGAGVLQVPLSAMFRDSQQWAVFVASGGRARLQHVSIGQSNNEHAEVLAGLKPGQQVILHPSDKIRDGVRIMPRPATSNGQPGAVPAARHGAPLAEADGR